MILRPSTPIVSVLTTCYNRQALISIAIDSVLSSTYKDFEYIIVDDGSTDQTFEIAKKYESIDSRVKVFRNEKNLGDYFNRNKAASHATGKYLKYLDSDDYIYPHGLQVMVDCMEQFPDAGFGLSAPEDPAGPFPILVSPKQAYLEHFASFGHFYRAPGSAIIKREAFEAVGGFTGERMVGDTELWFRMARQYPLVKFMSFLYWSRVHADQESPSDYAKTQNVLLYRSVVDRAFSHPDCPLTPGEKDIARKSLSKQSKLHSAVRMVKRKLRHLKAKTNAR